MARRTNILTPLAVSKASKPGAYGDGNNLYLQIGKTGGKSWLLRYMQDGKARKMGLGEVADIPLALARERATDARRLLREGIDPIDSRRAKRAEERLAKARELTFKECAEKYIATKSSEWKNAKHASQWENTLRDYAYPLIGDLSVAAIDTALIVKVLTPIWNSKTETATRLRGRIESILDWATTSKFRQGENPARWRGHLENLLPKPNKIAKVKHHPALPYEQINEFMESLKGEEGIAARALELTILTAARTNEVIGAKWSEFDLDKALWVIPAERMKMKKEHRVPLTARVMDILREMRTIKLGDYVFPSMREGRPMSNMAMLKVLERMKRKDLTVHGFRSTFRDWAAETTNYPQEVAEMALAHAVGDKVEAAYRRGDLFDKRRRIMEDWAKYCAMPKPSGEVIPIHSKSAA